MSQEGFGNKTAAPAPGTTPTISSGSGAPGTTPSKVGDLYIDTNAPALYYAKATASSADWIAVTNAA